MQARLYRYRNADLEKAKANGKLRPSLSNSLRWLLYMIRIGVFGVTL